MPRRLTRLVIALLAATAGAAGCTARHRACAPPERTRASGLVPATPTADEPVIVETELLRSLADQTRAANAAGEATARPGKFLALSGGGKYGAYTVGVLSGWTATGT